MPRLSPQELLAARRRKRESLGNSLLQGILGLEREFKEAIEDIDNVMFAAVEAALWHWFYEILPRHFGRNATELYGYPPRNRGYMVGKFIGKATGHGGPSKWRFPRRVAYALANWQSSKDDNKVADDPYPLELSGTFKTRVLAGPIGKNQGVRVRRIRGGYMGVITLDTAPYVKRHDLEALKRYNNADLEQMLGVVRMVVSLAFRSQTTSRRLAYAS